MAPPPDLRDVLRRQQASRLAERGKLRTVMLAEPDEDLFIAPPGSILLAWAYDDDLLAPAADAFQNGRDPAGLLLSGDFAGVSLRRGDSDVLDAMPAIATFRYRDRDLVEGIVLPEAPRAIGKTIIPWVGTPVEARQFSIVSWLNDNGSALSGLVVLNPPVLDPESLAIVASLPGNIGELGIGSAGILGNVARFVGEVVAERVVNWAVDKAVDATKDVADAAAEAYDKVGREVVNEYNRIINCPRGVPVLRGDGVPGNDHEAVEGATLEQLLARRIQALGRWKS